MGLLAFTWEKSLFCQILNNTSLPNYHTHSSFWSNITTNPPKTTHSPHFTQSPYYSCSTLWTASLLTLCIGQPTGPNPFSPLFRTAVSGRSLQTCLRLTDATVRCIFLVSQSRTLKLVRKHVVACHRRNGVCWPPVYR